MTLKEELVAAFEAAAKEPPKAVTIKGFPTFYVRPLSIGEVDEQNANKDEWIKTHQLTAGAAMVICDAEGVLLFDPSNADEMRLIFKQSWPRMQQILAAMNEGEAASGN